MKNKLLVMAVIIACLCLMSACGDQDSWMSGTFEGTSKVTRKDSFNATSGEVVSTGKGTVTFNVGGRMRLDDNMPLPNCNLQFSYRKDMKDYENVEREFTGKTGNDGYGCKSVYGTTSSFKIRIVNALMTRDDKGEMVLRVNYEADDLPDSSTYELEFRGAKKGWF